MDLNASTMYPRDLKNWHIFSSLESKFLKNVRIAAVYGCSANNALIVTKDNMVYSIGKCRDTGSIFCPKKIEILCGEDIKTIAYGTDHVLVLTQQGKIYSWGCNCKGELGTPIHSQTPILISDILNGEFFIDIACGSHHSLALTNKGQVYAWGNFSSIQANLLCGGGNSFALTIRQGNTPSLQVNQLCGTSYFFPVNLSPKNGQPSQPAIIEQCKTKPMLMTDLSNVKIVRISCGHCFSMALTDNGQVYSWGDNSVGQLGTKSSSSNVPCKITALAEIIIEKIVCGYKHTLALSDKGDLYVWGDNSYGQLGYIDSSIQAGTPTKLKIPGISGRVLDIATSHYHFISVAKSEGNQIFIWGQCYGQQIQIPMLTTLKCLYYAFAYYASPNIMHQPFIFHSDKESNLADNLRDAFDDPTTSDLTIQVHGKSIHVHKVILKIRSNYFKMMFQEHWIENSQSTIEHEQFSYDAYKAFLKYLYTDEIDSSTEIILELLELANAYSENQLIRHCVRIICKKITVQNVAFLYNTSIQHNSKELEECCFKFALNHMTTIIQTAAFAELDKNTMKTFIVRAAQAGAFKT
ncbi:RCC1 and BTB domain-containing protein 1-like isoform X2 [Frieseomelitta varia]|uniref:RCC1 and BTB domain-containing protein 1-like isoform X2 n=1 Tax=Frieseomelitta varia TaxID=561572 RepID=UPI001CB6A038|nr:RCC1 and BTB domain-containing protein 1-like isoform X2 [Frieseomelitta varia]XP_043513900.1 RCC1 and BTB domain-containing protein 1-like isoform X2 [Frieseomelitta varia]